MKPLRQWMLRFCLIVCSGEVSAFCIAGDSQCPQTGTGWPGAAATFYANGYVGSSATFNAAFVQALNNWNGLSNFNFYSIGAAADPCNGEPDYTSGWKFASTLCGTNFGDSTLAFTSIWANSFTPSVNEIFDADIVFNSTWTWDVHSGSGGNIDFRRVATHELGHALGLGHDNTRAALMNTLYSDSIETPQTDEINGLITLYGGGLTGTFTDVPMSHWAYNDIENLYASGITGGCASNPLRYCPDGPVTRAQMAVFIGRGIHGSGWHPPAATGGYFTDVPTGHWAAAWIEQFARDGITSGCGAARYCPSNHVTRDQMAIFLLRALRGVTYQPPPQTGVFSDVPIGHWAGPWIEQLVAEGITGGCDFDRYCPSSIVSRDQMAAFLVRTSGL